MWRMRICYMGLLNEDLHRSKNCAKIRFSCLFFAIEIFEYICHPIRDKIQRQKCCCVLIIIRDVAQPGSAFAWGARGRWFESSRPDKKIKPAFIAGFVFYYCDSV